MSEQGKYTEIYAIPFQLSPEVINEWWYLLPDFYRKGVSRPASANYSASPLFMLCMQCASPPPSPARRK
jgi:hypothetical protein